MYARISNPSVIHSRLKYIDGISEGDTNLFADTTHVGQIQTNSGSEMCIRDRDYIGDGVLEDFQTYYKEQTGENIRIVYQTFDLNEIMLTKIEKGHEDFDVVCPSEYIICLLYTSRCV